MRGSLILALAEVSVLAAYGVAQSGYAVSPPIAPTSYKECDEFQARLQQRQTEALDADKSCNNKVVQEFYAAIDANDEFGFHRREACFGNCWPEHTSCGDAWVTWKRCEPADRAVACAQKDYSELPMRCRQEVRAYLARQSSDNHGTAVMQPSDSRQHSSGTSRSATAPAGATLRAPSLSASSGGSNAQVIAGATIAALGSLIPRDRPDSDNQLGKTRDTHVIDDAAAAATAPPAIDKDTFAALGKTADPVSNALESLLSDNSGSPQVPDDAKEGAFDIGKKLVDKGIEDASAQISQERDAAKAVLTGRELESYEQEAEHASDYVEGLGYALKTVEYGKDAGLILTASDDTERAHATSDMFTDVVKDGVIAVVKRLTPRVAAVLEGPVGWIAGSLLDSTQERMDPVAVVNDTSDRYSLQDKQKALDDLMAQYDHNRNTWSKTQVEWLMQTANRIYSTVSVAPSAR